MHYTAVKIVQDLIVMQQSETLLTHISYYWEHISACFVTYCDYQKFVRALSWYHSINVFIKFPFQVFLNISLQQDHCSGTRYLKINDVIVKFMPNHALSCAAKCAMMVETGHNSAITEWGIALNLMGPDACISLCTSSWKLALCFM